MCALERNGHAGTNPKDQELSFSWWSLATCCVFVFGTQRHLLFGTGLPKMEKDRYFPHVLNSIHSQFFFSVDKPAFWCKLVERIVLEEQNMFHKMNKRRSSSTSNLFALLASEEKDQLVKKMNKRKIEKRKRKWFEPGLKKPAKRTWKWVYLSKMVSFSQ